MLVPAMWRELTEAYCGCHEPRSQLPAFEEGIDALVEFRVAARQAAKHKSPGKDLVIDPG